MPWLKVFQNVIGFRMTLFLKNTLVLFSLNYLFRVKNEYIFPIKPLLEMKGLDVQIMAGEVANWKIAGWYLYMMQRSMKEPSKQIDIVASHGYSLPQLGGNLMVTYETSPGSWFLSRKFKRRWITEASCTMCFDGKMMTAIKLATSLHHFIANNNVSAYIYWLAMMDHYSNDALIFEDKSRDKLIYPKAYYVFGQFTKWIRPGMTRYDLTKKFFKYDSTGTMASIYLNEKTNDFVLVVINPHKKKQSTIQIDFNGARIENEANLAGYKTTDECDWELMSAEEFELKNDEPFLTLINEPYSVRTITGKLVFENSDEVTSLRS